MVAPIEPSPVGAGGVHYSLEDDRLVEVSDEGSTEVGRVVAGHAGARLVLAWHGRHWAAASADHTEVEITFEPDGAGTRVTVEHRGWTGVRTGDAATAVIGLWWGDLLAGYIPRRSPRACRSAVARSHLPHGIANLVHPHGVGRARDSGRRPGNDDH